MLIRESIIMNTKGIFSKEHDHWSTPEDLRAKLYGEFDLNYDPCPLFCETDALGVSWAGKRMFCNPPYSNIPAFLAKRDEPDVAVYLLPSRTGTKWFHGVVLPHAKEIRFLRGRLKFGNSKTSAPFDSLIAIFAYVQERVDQQMRELEHAALDVIEWENEYRTLNNLGKYPPSPFVRLAICASKRAKT